MAKDNFAWACPFRLIYRAGAVVEVGNLIKERNLKKALIVTDKGVRGSGAVGFVEESLKAVGVGYAIYDGVVGNPPIANVNDGLKVYFDKKCDCIVSVGGGSPIDVAKAIGMCATNGGAPEDYDIMTGKKFPPTIPMPFSIAVPTTAGTGSEATFFAVITDPARKYKMAVAGQIGFMDYAILDPELSFGLPPDVTAATGMDALTHAVECYTTHFRLRNPMSDMTCKEAIRLISGNLRQAVANGNNVEARGNMLVASLMAGMSFVNGGLGLVHSLAHNLGAIYDIPHGIANAIILPHVMRYNMISDPQRFAEIAELMGENITGLTVLEAADKSIQAVERLSKEIGIVTIADLGLNKDTIPELAKAAYYDFQTQNNNRVTPADYSDLVKILEAAW